MQEASCDAKKATAGWALRNLEFVGAPSFGVGRAGLLPLASLHAKLQPSQAELFLVGEFHSHRKNGFGPFRSPGQMARIDYFSAGHVKQKLWLRSDSLLRIGLRTIVIDAKLRELGHEVHEMEPALVVPLADFGLGDVVSAMGDSGTHARDVKFRRGQSDEPNAHFDLFG